MEEEKQDLAGPETVPHDSAGDMVEEKLPARKVRESPPSPGAGWSCRSLGCHACAVWSDCQLWRAPFRVPSWLIFVRRGEEAGRVGGNAYLVYVYVGAFLRLGCTGYISPHTHHPPVSDWHTCVRALPNGWLLARNAAQTARSTTPFDGDAEQTMACCS